jgi:hypothetical protein
MLAARRACRVVVAAQSRLIGASAPNTTTQFRSFASKDTDEQTYSGQATDWLSGKLKGRQDGKQEEMFSAMLDRMVSTPSYRIQVRCVVVHCGGSGWDNRQAVKTARQKEG